MAARPLQQWTVVPTATIQATLLQLKLPAEYLGLLEEDGVDDL